jgi:hypothetical protein
LPQHRHIAPRKIFHKNSIFFCGAWGCLSYQEHFAKTEKNSANLEKPSHSRSVNSSFHSRLMCFSILSAFFFSFFSFGKISRVDCGIEISSFFKQNKGYS